MLTEQDPAVEQRSTKSGNGGEGGPPSTQVNEEYWDLLLAHIEEGNVVPIVGADLLTVEHENKPTPFYRIVAEELLASNQVPFAEHDALDSSAVPCYSEPVVLRRGYELMDAVCAINKQTGKPLDEFHVSINKIVKQKVALFQNNLPRALLSLAAIEPLSLFVSTTSDNLLATAINQVRHANVDGVCEIEYAPNLSSDRLRDLPENWNKEQGAVFYLFGKTSAGQSNAIHEEDMLEWVYSLQRDPEAGPEKLLKLIRGKNLLFIGCPINDWLGRFLVRTSTAKRLLDRRGIFEFMVFDPVSMDPGLRLFLERFSQNSKLCYDKPGDFVDELLRRWRELHPESSQQTSSDTATQNRAKLSGNPKGAIFISYASQDFQAAQNLCNQLRNIAGDDDIAWLDKDGGLVGGDDWEQVIRRTITKDCKLFIPLISSHTQQRTEGVFRKEWNWAEQRDAGIFGKKFILPLLVDEEVVNTPSSQLLVNERFTRLHLQQAIGGAISEDLREELITLIREIRRG